jgi:nitroreductase
MAIASASDAQTTKLITMIQTPTQKTVDEVIRSRHSIRAFLPTPVAQEDIEAILEVAARAPSGSNTQPWRVYVVTGATRDRLAQNIVEAYLDPTQNAAHTEEYPYYPRQWVSPYIERRRKVGWDLYALLGLTRDNKSGMQAQHARNFAFFDAPVGLIFTIDRVMDQGSWLDYGMFLQTLMIAARARGLDTCPQAAFTQFHRLISETLAIPAEQQVVCGMALGYADPAKAENSLMTERANIAEFATFMG